MNIKENLVYDFAGCLAVLAVSAAVGLGVNSLRSEPIPLVYESPGASFQKSELVGHWKPGIHLIDTAQAQLLVGERSALILDARPDLFFEFGHLPNAENLSRKNLESDYVKLSVTLVEAESKGVPILVYCAHEHCEDASIVARFLQEKGHTQTSILIYEPGYDAWERNGFRVVQK